MRRAASCKPGRPLSYSDNPGYLMQRVPLLIQVYDALERLQVRLHRLQGMVNVRRHLGRLLALQPEPDRNFLVGDAGADVLDSPPRGHDNANLPQIRNVAPHRPDVTHENLPKILLGEKPPLLARLLAHPQQPAAAHVCGTLAGLAGKIPVILLVKEGEPDRDHFTLRQRLPGRLRCLDAGILQLA